MMLMILVMYGDVLFFSIFALARLLQVVVPVAQVIVGCGSSQYW